MVFPWLFCMVVVTSFCVPIILVMLLQSWWMFLAFSWYLIVLTTWYANTHRLTWATLFSSLWWNMGLISRSVFNTLKMLCKALHNIFKECKQNLLLGKCQSNDFDAQIADATLCMIRYILLSYCERIRYGITIGGLFRELSQATAQDNLLTTLNGYFFELLKLCAEMVSVDFIGFYQELLRNPRAEKLLTAIGVGQHKILFSNAAWKCVFSNHNCISQYCNWLGQQKHAKCKICWYLKSR